MSKLKPAAGAHAQHRGTMAPASVRSGARPGVGDALLVVDLQRDFLPGGSLAVARGDRVLPTVARWLRHFEAAGLPVFASRDWHPGDHCSFRAHGGPWPSHCVADTPGAAFADTLRWPEGVTVVSKATHRDRDAYSAFDGTDLHARLQTLGVRRLFVCGLATDYCVQASAGDALGLGYDVVVLRDGIAAVDVHAGDGDRALEALRARGAVVALSDDCLS